MVEFAVPPGGPPLLRNPFASRGPASHPRLAYHLDNTQGSERGPVALPVFKTGLLFALAGRLGSTPRRFRHPIR